MEAAQAEAKRMWLVLLGGDGNQEMEDTQKLRPPSMCPKEIAAAGTPRSARTTPGRVAFAQTAVWEILSKSPTCPTRGARLLFAHKTSLSRCVPLQARTARPSGTDPRTQRFGNRIGCSEAVGVASGRLTRAAVSERSAPAAYRFRPQGPHNTRPRTPRGIIRTHARSSTDEQQEP